MGQRGGGVGCGPIGLFAIQWMKLMGCTEVVAVDAPSASWSRPARPGRRTPFLVTEPPPAASSATSSSRRRPSFLDQPRGRAGGARRPCRAHRHPGRRRGAGEQDLPAFSPPGDLAARRLELFPARPFPGRQWRVALDALASGALKWEFMITHELELRGPARHVRDVPRQERLLLQGDVQAIGWSVAKAS